MSTAAPGTHPDDYGPWAERRATHELSHILLVMRTKRPMAAHRPELTWPQHERAHEIVRKHADALAAELKAEGWNVE